MLIKNKLDNINFWIIEKKIQNEKLNLKIMKESHLNNEKFAYIVTKLESYINYIEELLNQYKNSNVPKIKIDLLDYINQFLINDSVSDLYNVIPYLLFAKDDNYNSIICYIVTEIKNLLGIKKDIIIVNSNEFSAMPVFNPKFMNMPISVDSFYIITVNRSLSFLGIPQIAHEMLHLATTEIDYEKFEQLHIKIKKLFVSQKVEKNLMAKIEELTCDIFAAHIFNLTYPYSYILSFNLTFDLQTTDHFDDYFRMMQVINCLGYDNIFKLFFADFKESLDYKNYFNIMNDITAIYKKFFNTNYKLTKNLTKVSQCLSIEFDKIFNSEKNLDLNDINKAYETIFLKMVQTSE